MITPTTWVNARGTLFAPVAMLVLAVAVAPESGCRRARSGTDSSTASGSSSDRVTQINKDDEAMNAAIAKARETVDTFIVRLKSPQSGDTIFSVKVPIADSANTEHFWLTNVRFDGAKFNGTINNDPVKVTHVKLGQNWSVNRDEISDWMIVSNAKLIGGESIRALRSKMSPEERAAFDAQAPFKIE